MSLIPSINKYVGDTCFPATKQDILAKAKEHEAPDQVIDVLNELPEVKFYGMTDLLRFIIR